MVLLNNIDLPRFGNLKVNSERSLRKVIWWLLNGFCLVSSFYDIPSVKYCVENDCCHKQWNENRKLPIVVLGNPHCFLVGKYTTRKPPGNPHYFLVSKCTTRKPPGFISNDNRKLPIVSSLRKPPGNPHHFLVSKYTTRKPPGNPQETPRKPIVVLGNPQETPIIF